MILKFFFAVLLFFGMSGLAMVGWMMMHRPAPVTASKAPPPPPTVSLLTASEDIQGGVILSSKQVTTSSVLTSQKPADAFVDTPENRRALTGAFSLRPIGANQPIVTRDIISPEDRGFAAAVLTPGRIAETVSVTAVTGAGGLVWPGDHVDVLLTLQDADAHVTTRKVGTTVLLTDVRVIGVNQHLAHSSLMSQEDAKLSNSATQESPIKDVTLELMPEDAPKIATAQHMGEIRIVIRSALPSTDQAAGEPLDNLATEASPPAIYYENDVVPEMTAKAVVRLHAGQQDAKEYAQ